MENFNIDMTVGIYDNASYHVDIVKTRMSIVHHTELTLEQREVNRKSR